MSRLFIVDPVCALPFGHNLNALHAALDYFAQQGVEARAFSSRILPKPLGRDRIEREFTFLYSDVINVRDLASVAEQRVMRQYTTPALKTSTATGEMRALIQAFGVTSADGLFFPSIDYYSGIGALRALGTLESDQYPTLYMRFIGVMERTAPDVTHPREQLLAEIRRAARVHPDKIHLCAETPRLASLLADETGLPFSVLPYPLAAEPVDMPMDGPLVVLAAGASRVDKGYDRLLEIVETVNEIVEPGSVEFIMQGAPDDVVRNAAPYTEALHAEPSIHMLPAVLPDSVLMEAYKRSHVAILPYDPAGYYDRGSAVMQEAVAVGRYVIGQSGTGFAAQISQYGIGLLAQSDEDFGIQIARIAAQPRSKLQTLALEARGRYAGAVDEAHREFFRW